MTQDAFLFRFDHTPLATPNGEILIKDLSFEVSPLRWARHTRVAASMSLYFFVLGQSISSFLKAFEEQNCAQLQACQITVKPTLCCCCSHQSKNSNGL